MEMIPFIETTIQEKSDIAESRRVIRRLANDLGFAPEAIGKIEIAVTEAATNILKHGSNGSILGRSTNYSGISQIEVLALDRGCGISNVHRSMQDGYSTGGSQGTGLGSIQRQADYFDIFSAPERGTAILMQFRAKKPKAAQNEIQLTENFDIGIVTVPIKGESDCGDGCVYKRSADGILVLASDGLGHGVLAADATREAGRLFEQSTETAPSSILRDLHLGLRATRGVAASIVDVNIITGMIRYAGVGNILGIVTDGTATRHMISQNGTLGATAPKFQEFNYPWPPDSLLVLASDGITTQVSMKDYTGLARRHPTLIAAVLYRDFNRGRDDAMVAVFKRRQK